MDFRKLSHVDFEEFFSMNFSEYGVHNDTQLQVVQQVEKKYEQLCSINGPILPLPIQDLELHSRCEREGLGIMTTQDILDLSFEAASVYIRGFGLNPLPLEINRRRILRIMSYLGLIEDPHHLLLIPTVLEELSSTLSIDDLSNLQIVLNVQQLDCWVPIHNSNDEIKSIRGFRFSYRGIIESIARDGSKSTFTFYVINNLGKNVTLMLNWGYNVNRRNTKGKTVLVKVAKYGKMLMARLLLSRDVNPNIKDEYGSTALMYAAMKGHLEMVQLLLSHKANPFAETNKGKRVLSHAIAGGNNEIVEILLQLGLDPNYYNEWHVPALIQACESGDLEILRTLLKYKADTNLVVPGSKGALSMAAGGGWFEGFNRRLNYEYNDEDDFVRHIVLGLRLVVRIARKRGWTDIIDFFKDYSQTQEQLKVAWPEIIKKYEPHYLEIVKVLIEAGAHHIDNDISPSVSASRIGFMNIYNFVIQFE